MPKSFISILLIFNGIINFSFGQILTENAIQNLRSSIIDVQLDSTYRNGNWATLDTILRDKKLVLLGEVNHGVREIFVARNDLIQHLHQALGFEVILFECGLGEQAYVDLHRERLSPKTMTRSLFGVWHTEAFQELAGYIKQHQIPTSGFDVQQSGGGGFYKLLEELATTHALDTMLFHDLEIRFNQLKRQLYDRKINYDSIAPSKQQLVADYQVFQSEIKQLNIPKNNKSYLLIQRTIDNRVYFLDYMGAFFKHKDYHKRWADRDSMMAGNIHWLVNTIYPDKKIIIVAHNYHIAKHNEKESVMGAFLQEKYADEMYAIGIFSGPGKHTNNRHWPIEMEKPDSKRLDIQHIIKNQNARVGFLPISKKQISQNPWLNKKIVVNNSFIDLVRGDQVILAKQYDGIILIDQTSIPKFLN